MLVRSRTTQPTQVQVDDSPSARLTPPPPRPPGASEQVAASCIFSHERGDRLGIGFERNFVGSRRTTDAAGNHQSEAVLGLPYREHETSAVSRLPQM